LSKAEGGGGINSEPELIARGKAGKITVERVVEKSSGE